jgi:hypothetical protein
MLPAVGSYIWQRLMAAAFKASQQVATQPVAEEPAKADEPTASPEDKLRSLCVVAFMQLSYDDTAFIQNTCMKIVSRVELIGDTEAAIPIMQQDGTWAAPDVMDNPFLITQLTTEVIVFNLASFLAESSPAQKL